MDESRNDAFDYFHLNSTIGDDLRKNSTQSQENKVWTIINILPIKLHLYREVAWTEEIIDLGIIQGRSKILFSPAQFNDGDKLLVVYEQSNTSTSSNKEIIPFFEPYTLRPFYKDIYLGAVEYRSSDGHLQVQASNWDLRGVNLHNKLLVPIDVYYKGNLVVQMYGNDGMTYLGGSAATVYFDNNREGLNFGDALTFKLSLPNDNTELFTVTIDDIHCQEIYIGTISCNFVGPNPDTFAYSVDRDVWTGITYYKPIGGYRTSPTNPYAPF